MQISGLTQRPMAVRFSSTPTATERDPLHTQLSTIAEAYRKGDFKVQDMGLCPAWESRIQARELITNPQLPVELRAALYLMVRPIDKDMARWEPKDREAVVQAANKMALRQALTVSGLFQAPEISALGL
jgi:hypothetical protein